MSTSIIQQKVTDPEFSDSTYEYEHTNNGTRVVTNTFPSAPTISSGFFTFNIAKSGYKAVGIVNYHISHGQYSLYISPFAFNYANQTASFFCAEESSSSATSGRVSFSATIKYVKL